MAQSETDHAINPESAARSPSLEALYNDLDAFIDELSGQRDSVLQNGYSEQQQRSSLLRSKYLSGGTDYQDDEYVGYSPLLENYASGRPFSRIRGSKTLEQVVEYSVTDEKHQVPDDDNVSCTTSQQLQQQQQQQQDIKNTTLSPPMSPSFLGIASPNPSLSGGYFSTMRSSSLSNQQQQQQQQQQQSNTPLSTPSSPLLVARSPVPAPPPMFPNHSFLSELGYQFIIHVRQLNERRRMFCTMEYPASFTGEEAVQILKAILPGEVSSAMCVQVARAFIRTTPQLVAAISYSEKSLKRNTLYQSANEIYTLIEEIADEGHLPQGVFTPLTRCYTNFCLPGQGGCYAPSCPNRIAEIVERSSSSTKDADGLKRKGSFKSGTSSHDTTFSRSWSATVSREILQNTPPSEIKRQEAIHEIIYTEEDYVRDLNLLDELFAVPLRTAQCLEPERRDAFCDHVFNNYKEILGIHRDLLRDLRDRQSECLSKSSFVDKIGDIFLKHLPKFSDAYGKYGPCVPEAEYTCKREATSNMLFHHFLQDVEKKAECRKLPFRHFLVLPVIRLQRYPLLLSAILKRTPEDHPDHAFLTECDGKLRSIAATMDEETAASEKRLRLQQIHDTLRCKPSEIELVHQLRILEPGRQLLYEGALTRRSNTGVETINLWVFLFDNYFLMTKPKNNEYHLSKRPIPLELLHVADATEGFAIGMRSLTGSSSNSNPTPSGLVSPTFATAPSSPNQTIHSSGGGGGGGGGGHSPMVIQHLGRHGSDYMLFADTPETRLTWKEKIVEAKAALEHAHPERQVFEVRSVCDTKFRASGTPNFGKVTCSTPFEDWNGIRRIAVGTNLGVWMGVEGDTASMRQVLTLQDVTQIAVLEENHILVVLADKVLYAYALHRLDAVAGGKQTPPSQKLAQQISFFHAGICNNRQLVVAMRRRGMDSHFRAFEPVCGDLRDPKNAKYLATKSGLFAKSPPPWFKIYKEFYVGAESSAVQLLKARVVVVCIRGFEIIDPENLHMNHNLPDTQHTDFAPIAQSRPLGMFRCGGNYLLCYDTQCCLVDNHGRLIPNSWMEWEGAPQSVAFSYPYIVGFDSRFIEVRNAETGELIQILAGNHMRCLQFTHNSSAPVTPLIHGCMAHPFKPDFQYIFQLINTCPSHA